MNRKVNQSKLFLLASTMLVFVMPAYSASTASLESRMDKLEQENILIKKHHRAFKEEIGKTLDDRGLAQDIVTDIERQIRSDMKISGYADVEYKDSTKSGDKPGFRIHHFSLFFTKNISERWRLFSEIEYEDAPKFEGDGSKIKSQEGKIFLEAMNVDLRWKPEMSFRFGRFFTPAGIWSIDHYPPFVTTQERPFHIRKIFPQLVDGALTFGRIKMGETFLKYDLYTGNGEGNTAAKDKNSSKAVGLNINLELPLFTHTDIGTTVYQDSNNKNDDVEKLAFGYHIKMQWDAVTYQAEFAEATYTPKSPPTTEYKTQGAYHQLGMRMGAFLVGVRYDIFDDFEKAVTSPIPVAARNAQKERNTLFFNYRVNKDIVIKLEHHQVKPEFLVEYEQSIATIAVNLGN